MEPKSILNTLKRSSVFDLFLVAFLLLPFVLIGWLEVLERTELEGISDLIFLGIITALYVIGILIMLTGTKRLQRNDKRLFNAKEKIEFYLKCRPNTEKASFNRIRSSVDEAYSDPFLFSLISRYSATFFRGAFTRNNPAIGLLDRDSEEPPEESPLNLAKT